MFADELLDLAEEVLGACRASGLRLALAESCTGGLISACLTAVPGSSDVLERGFVVYSNEAKASLLGVPEALIAAHGAVSEKVARSLAEGCLEHAPADLGAAVTGIAGPGGGTAEKPVGLVHIAVARRNFFATLHQRHLFEGDRQAVRIQALKAALMLIKPLAKQL